MANGKRMLLAASTVTEGGNSISLNLNDSWTGRKLLEALDIPPARFSPELMDVSVVYVMCVGCRVRL